MVVVARIVVMNGEEVVIRMGLAIIGHVADVANVLGLETLGQGITPNAGRRFRLGKNSTHPVGF